MSSMRLTWTRRHWSCGVPPNDPRVERRGRWDAQPGAALDSNVLVPSLAGKRPMSAPYQAAGDGHSWKGPSLPPGATRTAQAGRHVAIVRRLDANGLEASAQVVAHGLGRARGEGRGVALRAGGAYAPLGQGEAPHPHRLAGRGPRVHPAGVRRDSSSGERSGRPLIARHSRPCANVPCRARSDSNCEGCRAPEPMREPTMD